MFALTFILGWILQLVGHLIEGKRPALLDNFWQALIAPLFLTAEVFFMSGRMAKDLQHEIYGSTEPEPEVVEKDDNPAEK